MPETTMPETVVDEPGIADSPIASIDPKDAARAMAVEAAEDENGCLLYTSPSPRDCS